MPCPLAVIMVTLLTPSQLPLGFIAMMCVSSVALGGPPVRPSSDGWMLEVYMVASGHQALVKGNR